MRRIGVLILIIGLCVALGLAVTRSRGTASSAGGAEDRTLQETPIADGSGRNGSDASIARRPPAHVGGRVRSQDDRPIVGAEVCAWSERVRVADRVAPACARTDEIGRFRIDGLAADEYRISASARGFVPGPPVSDRASQLRLRAGEARSDLDIVLAAGGVPLTGTVTDVLGGAIEGARVFSGNAFPFRRLQATATTGLDGRFELWVVPGQSLLWAEADGYARGERDVTAPGPEVELRLTPASRLAGIVVDDRDRPVEGATVDLPDPDGRDGSVVATTVTDAQGRSRLEDLAPGHYHPTTHTAGAYGETDSSVGLGLAESIEDLRIELVAAGSLVVHVRSHDETPCPRGLVFVSDEILHRAEVASLDDEGRAHFLALAPGAYAVAAQCTETAEQGRLGEPVSVGGDGTTETTLELRKPLVLHGIVREDSAALADVEISAYQTRGRAGALPVHGRSDGEGRFTIDGVYPGAYEIHASSSRHAWVQTANVEVDDDGAPPIEITFPGGATVKGQVVDGNGAPVAGVSVGVRASAAGRFTLVDTGEDGRFRLEGLDPGRYVLVAEVRAGPRSEPRELDLKSGEKLEVDVALPVRDARIDGRLLDADGDAVPDAHVYAARQHEAAGGERERRLLRQSASVGWIVPVLTDEEGRFSITGLEAEARYTLLARRPGGGEVWAYDVAAGADPTLRLPALATITGTVTTPESGAPTMLVVTARDASTGTTRTEAFRSPRSSFRLDDLPAGRFEVTATAAEGRASASVTVEPGATSTVELELVGHITVKGRFVDLASGEPIEGLVVGIGAEDATLTDLASELERVIVAGTRGHLTRSDGRFEVRVPVGVVHMLVVSSDVLTGAYGPHFVELTATPALAGEMQTIELVRRRFATGDTVGVLGIERQPSADPFCEDAVLGRVPEGTSAHAAGLVAGDRLVAIDGVSVAGRDCYRADWQSRVTVGTTVKVDLADGRTVELTAR